MTKTFKKLTAAMALSLAMVGGVAATPAAARDHRHYQAGDYYRGYDRGGYDRDYYRRGDYYRGSRYDRYDRDDYRRYRGYRCRDNGTGGAIVGAIAGGLLGNEVARRGDRTTGAVLGAAIGAVAGHAIDKGDRRC